MSAAASLMEQVFDRAWTHHVPFSVQLDVTYRCNERCEHCYLDHTNYGELTTAEIKRLLDELAEAGVFFLSVSGGEVFLRRDLFEILAHARALGFHVRLKSNAVLIGEAEARKLHALGIAQVQVSVYSARPEVHDAITKLPGSLARTLGGIHALRAAGVNVTLANVLMTSNASDFDSVRHLAAELGAQYSMDPTITPMMDGDTEVLKLRIPSSTLKEVFRNPALVGDVDNFCAPPPPVDDSIREGYSCSAGHTAAYVSPYGDVYPCVQFPLPCGNIREKSFQEIWSDSPELARVRSIRVKDLTTCSACTHAGSCTRCPGLAYLEGDMRGPSSADCEKSYARTGIITAGMLARPRTNHRNLIQIQPAR